MNPLLQRAYSTWCRHDGDSYFHAISSIAHRGPCVTLCNGSWLASDLVECSESPGEDERCAECQRRMLDVKRIERGLQELRDTAFAGGEPQMSRHWLAEVE